jgi:hypothetical protein
MSMSEHIEKLIIKALQGNILPEEHDELDRWLAEGETNRKKYNQFVSVWQLSANGSKPVMIDSDAEWNRLEKAIDAPPAVKEKILISHGHSVPQPRLRSFYFAPIFTKPGSPPTST